MPPKKSYSKRKYKRKSKRKYGRNFKNRVSRRFGSTVAQPDTYLVKLVYNETIITAPASFVGQQHMSGNSAFDPNSTGVGGQPVGFDQYAGLYDHYEVLASKIQLLVLNNGTMNSQVTILPQHTSTNPGFDDNAGSAYSKQINVGPLTGNSVGKLSSYMSTKKLIGRNTSSLNYAAPVTTNPAARWYWYLNMRTSDAATFLNLTIQYKITYYVKFWRRLTMADA